MKALEHYLDYMFSSLPDTQDTQRARSELLEIMEDKYDELVAQGLPEHYAMSQVIADFGDVDELAADMGIAHAPAAPSTQQGEAEQAREKVESPSVPSTRQVDLQVATEFVEHRRERAYPIARGIAACILAPLVLICASIAADGRGEMIETLAAGAGLVVMAALVGLGIYLFMKNPYAGEFEELAETPLAPSISATYCTEQNKKEFKPTYTRTVTGSVIAYIVAALIVIIGSMASDSVGDWLLAASLGIALIVVAIATYHLVVVQTIMNGMNVILQVDDYTVAKKTSHSPLGMISGVFWLLTVAVFLLVSYLGSWETSWLVWPIAALIYGAIAVAVNYRWGARE